VIENEGKKKKAQGRKRLWSVNPDTGEELSRLTLLLNRADAATWDAWKAELERDLGYMITNAAAFEIALNRFAK
jgi:hypothetical protein